MFHFSLFHIMQFLYGIEYSIRHLYNTLPCIAFYINKSILYNFNVRTADAVADCSSRFPNVMSFSDEM